MKVAVWDTYVTKKDGSIMHFDIIVPEEMKSTNTIYNYGKTYLNAKGQAGQILTAKECIFCHIEHLQEEKELEIKTNGFYIIEMENCN